METWGTDGSGGSWGPWFTLDVKKSQLEVLQITFRHTWFNIQILLPVNISSFETQAVFKETYMHYITATR